MKVLIALLFAASQLFASTLGLYDGFYVYGGRTQTASRHSYVGFGFYPALPDCKLIERFPGYFAMDDVSKNHGVACDGDGCPQTQKDPQRLDRVEMNVEFGHYTWYKNRDNNLVDLGDRVVGKCFEQHEIFTSGEVHCRKPTDKGENKVDLYPYLWCDTKVWKV